MWSIDLIANPYIVASLPIIASKIGTKMANGSFKKNPRHASKGDVCCVMQGTIVTILSHMGF
jgi:hypothetical protein